MVIPPLSYREYILLTKPVPIRLYNVRYYGTASSYYYLPVQLYIMCLRPRGRLVGGK